MIKIAVLVSGNGSNLQAIIDACKAKKIKGQVAIVISNVERAYALKRAEAANIKAVFINNEKETIKILLAEKIDLVALAGYMKLVSSDFIKAFPNKIMNIHPALLPSFKGLKAQKQALDYGVKITGATVHFVDQGMDTGPIILQKAVEIVKEDDLNSLSKKILMAEHQIYIKAISLFAEGKLKLIKRTVYYD